MSSRYDTVPVPLFVPVSDPEAEASDEDVVSVSETGAVRLRNEKVLRRVMGAWMRWPWVVRIALVEGGRAGMWGGTESVRVRARADGRVGRRLRRRWVMCMVGCCGLAMGKGGLGMMGFAPVTM